MSQTSVLYLDYQATTPCDQRVVEAMLPWFSEDFGNPHSTSHAYGQRAAEAVETARAQVAALIGADPREIVFTSGATESNNLAIKGAVRFLAENPGRKGRRKRVVTLASEHKCVLEACRRLEREGFEVAFLPVQANGLVDLEVLAEALSEETALLSVMAVNNEIGVIQPLEEIGKLCRERGVLFHCDAAQGVGKIPLDVEAMQADLLSISGHKLYGPKGIGALYVRRRPRVRLEPLFNGGGQERGYRSGTLPTPLCVGLGRACVIAGAEMATEADRLARLSRRLREGLEARQVSYRLNGDAEARIPGNLNLSFPGVLAPDLIDALPELAVSTGSACTSAEVEPSYVLRALGLDETQAAEGLRIGLGRPTSREEVEHAAALIAEAVARLQREGGGRDVSRDVSRQVS